MKLVIAVVNSQDADALAAELTARSVGMTRLKSTGGFLRKGNTTFFIGVEDQRLHQTLALIKRICGTRTESSMPSMPDDMMPASLMEQPVDVVSGGAAIWVMAMSQFIKLQRDCTQA